MLRRRCASIEEANAAVAEATTQIRLRHPCILACEGVFLGGETDDGDQLVCLVTRLCDAGDLDHAVAAVRLGARLLARALTRTLAVRRPRAARTPPSPVRLVGVGRRVAVGTQLTADEREAAGHALLEALQYTAAQGIIHRDLKPANVLFVSDGKGVRRLVVGDFGLARSITDRVRTLTRRVGTPLFYAPEVDNEEHYGLAADIFSGGLPAATPCRLCRLACPHACPLASSGSCMRDRAGKNVWWQIAIVLCIRVRSKRGVSHDVSCSHADATIFSPRRCCCVSTFVVLPPSPTGRGAAFTARGYASAGRVASLL